jgi:WD40 repeat protein
LKRKTTWFALAVGVLVGVFSWWRLPFRRGANLLVSTIIEGLLFSPDGKTLAAIDHSQEIPVQLWDISTRINPVRIPLSPISPPPLNPPVGKSFAPLNPPSFAFSPDGKTFFIISLSSGKLTAGNVQFWDLAIGQGNMALLFHFDNGNIQVLDWPSGKRRTLHLNRSALTIGNAKSAVSPDGKLLALQVRNWVVLYGSSWNELARFDYATLPRFSPDGKTLVVHEDGALHLYDIPLRKPLGKILFFAMIGAAPFLLLGQVAAFWKRRRARNHKSDHEAGGER